MLCLPSYGRGRARPCHSCCWTVALEPWHSRCFRGFPMFSGVYFRSKEPFKRPPAAPPAVSEDFSQKSREIPAPSNFSRIQHFRNLFFFREKLDGVRVFHRCLRLLLSFVLKNSVIVLQHPTNLDFFIALLQLMQHSANVESRAVQKSATQ